MPKHAGGVENPFIVLVVAYDSKNVLTSYLQGGCQLNKAVRPIG